MAFKHRSILSITDNRKGNNNERLEFLGDAVLGSVISAYLFEEYTTKREGDLTQIRSRIVSRKMLNNVGLKVGLADFMEFKKGVESKTIYGDVLEALVGAIYLDKGYIAAKHFLVKRVLNQMDIHQIADEEMDFKSRVLEYGQQNKKEIKFVTSDELKGDKKLYKAELFINEILLGEGIGSTKKLAEQLAAKMYYNSEELNSL